MKIRSVYIFTLSALVLSTSCKSTANRSAQESIASPTATTPPLAKALLDGINAPVGSPERIKAADILQTEIYDKYIATFPLSTDSKHSLSRYAANYNF